MGMIIKPSGSRSSTGMAQDSPDPTPRNGLPNPYSFEVCQIEWIGDYVVVKVRYHDCTNYLGMKTMLYYKSTWEQVARTTMLDPHFLENALSPIARFVPTQLGWNMAKRMASRLSEGTL